MKKYKVLIVDDERPLVEMVSVHFSFEKDRFETRACYTGADALKEAESHRPDIILLDVMMGDMDGWEVLSRLRNNPKTASIPVVMCTARDSSSDIDLSFQRGAQAYLMKPIHFPRLLQKISAILDAEDLMKD
jgi:DNA-binding response OmpR family regulator